MKLKNKIDYKKILTIAATVLLFAAHVAVILIGIYAFRYYNMYPEMFNYIFIIIICIFIMIDIVYFVGIKYKDIIQKIIITVISLCMLIGGGYGAYVLKQANVLVDNIIQTGEEKQYETIGGVFVSYQNEDIEKIEDISDLSKISKFKLGALKETSVDSVSSVGFQQLSDADVKNYELTEYTNNTDLLFALINHEVDVAIFSNMYQAVFRADENVDYTQYLAEMHEISDFSKKIEVVSNASTKDLSKDPFNVLLIGWSPIIGSTTIGLADAIIVATVNPQTYTVSMMSIARDSYVPISCYGGECDKINSGRGTSMDCFVQTVEDLIDEEIDFYMEINFSGFADLCGHFGGIEIDNPVSFELDGVYVPAGKYVANGWQALEFARERHHMPNGDFDRQQHQKEVIMQLAKQFLSHSLTEALQAFNNVSDRLKTNLTLNQLTSMFNMLKNTKNNTGLSLFTLLDMHALRVTGYADWHYSDEYELPLWIYRLYNGSIQESLDHMQEVLGNYKTLDQDSLFSFNFDTPYVRDAFYSLSYDEVEEHEKLPPYYINLTKMTYADALIWAQENGATLIPTFISSDSAEYDEALDGMIISQSVAYGKKVSKYPVCNVTVMGDGKVKPKLPDNFDGWDIDHAKDWCKEKGYEYDAVAIPTDNKDKDNIVHDMYIEGDEIIIEYYVYAEAVKVPSLIGYSEDEAKSILRDMGLDYSVKYQTDNNNVGKVIGQNPSQGKEVEKGATVTITVGTQEQQEEKITVPNLIGCSADEAKGILESIGLKCNIDYQADNSNIGKVIVQNPSEGEKVDKGSRISITVGVEEEHHEEEEEHHEGEEGQQEGEGQ